MTPDPLTVTEDDTLEEIVKVMEKNHVKRLPVLRGDQLVGMVTRANLLQAVADLAMSRIRPPTMTISVIASSRRSSRKLIGGQRHSARHFGLKAIGTCSAANLAAVERFGATAIDYRAGDFVASVRAFAAGRVGGAGGSRSSIPSHRPYRSPQRILRPQR
jgi:CBS domain-containing protein